MSNSRLLEREKDLLCTVLDRIARNVGAPIDGLGGRCDEAAERRVGLISLRPTRARLDAVWHFLSRLEPELSALRRDDRILDQCFLMLAELSEAEEA